MPVKVTSFVNKVKKKLVFSTKTKMEDAKKKLQEAVVKGKVAEAKKVVDK